MFLSPGQTPTYLHLNSSSVFIWMIIYIVDYANVPTSFGLDISMGMHSILHFKIAKIPHLYSQKY